MENKSDTLSIGTESLYSSDNKNQTGGGFLSSLFGSSGDVCVAKIALNAFNDKFPQISCYIINDQLKNHETIDLSATDNKGRTLLHHLVVYCKTLLECKKILVEVLSKCGSKSYVNIQDCNGNTPAHYALYLELDDVVELLVQTGANLSIRNNKGYHIKPKQVSSNDIFSKISEREQSRDNELNRSIDNIVNMFRGTESDTIGYIRPTETAQVSDNNLLSDANSIDILKSVLNNFRGGSRKNNDCERVVGNRKMITYSEVSVGGVSDPELSDSSNLFARAVENKASEAHHNAVLRIKENLGVSDEEAKAYKALIWDKLKEEMKGSSNYDRSMELEKRASDVNYLKDISKADVDNMMEVIKKKLEDKSNSSQSSSEASEASEASESSQEEKPKRKRKTTKKSLSESSLSLSSAQLGGKYLLVDTINSIESL